MRSPVLGRARAAVITALTFGLVVLPTGSAGARSPQHTPARYTVVATGLDNPRGLSFLPNGRLVVGEAGHSGEDACFSDGGEGGPFCIGFTSQISQINVATGAHWPLVTGLVSAGEGPIATTGVDGVSTRGGKVFGIISASPRGLPPDEACAGDSGCVDALVRARGQVGELIRVTRNGSWKSVADVGRFNYEYIVANKATLDPDNPDFKPGDANPYGIDSVPSGHYVVDGGSNTLDWVSRSGAIKVLAYLPNPPGAPDERFPYDAVPTCVAASGRMVYVADLAGRVWTWANGQLTQMALPAGLLHSTNGCDVDSHGNLYVVDMFAGFDPDFGFAPGTGSVVKITPAGRATVIAEGLNLPAGIAVRGGDVYVSNNGICPADVTGLPPQLCPSSGEVVRLRH